MYMTNENVRLLPHDRLFAATILRLIPKEVTPNHITILRFILIPPTLFFLWIEDVPVALVFFLFAALTDAIDGSLARTRKQITGWGTVADPLADKLLIGSTVVFFVAKEVNVAFAGLIVFFEVMIALGALYRARRGQLQSANGFGKAKMLLQVLGVAALLIARLLDIQLAVQFGVGTLSIAIVFAIVSLLTYGL